MMDGCRSDLNATMQVTWLNTEPTSKDKSYLFDSRLLPKNRYNFSPQDNLNDCIKFSAVPGAEICLVTGFTDGQDMFDAIIILSKGRN